MLKADIFQRFNEQTIEEAPDDAVKEFLWYLWRGVAWVLLFGTVAVAVTLWFVFYVITAAWRDPKG